MKQYLTPEYIGYNLANLPQQVFEMTDAYNLRCKYCAYGEFYDDYDCRESKNLRNRFRRLEAQQLYFLSKHLEAYRKIMEKVIRM